MRLVAAELLHEFKGKHADSKAALEAWETAVRSKQFKHFVELKETFPAADYVKPYTVFDISGNRYRLIAVVSYRLGLVNIESVLTHADYGQGKWRH